MKIEPHLESMLPQLELRVLFGPQSGSRLTLSPGDYLLGTDEDCAVMLSGPRMQGIHARLSFDGDRPSIEPLDGSVTDAQGRAVEGNTPLALGMPVEMGGVWIAIDEIDAPWPDLDSVIPQPGTHSQPVPDRDDIESPLQTDAAESTTLVGNPAPEVEKQRHRARLMLMISAAVLLLIALAGIAGAAWLVARPVESVSAASMVIPDDSIITQLRVRLAEVAPGRHMSVTPGRDGKPEITGYVTDDAMEATVRDAIRKIVNTPGVHLYMDQELLVLTRKTAQALQDPSHAMFEVTDVANGIAVLNGSVTSQAVKEDVTEALRSRVPGLRGTEATLRMAEDLPALLQERMTTAGFGKKLQVIEQQPEFVVRGTLSEDELPRWENLLMAFSEQFGRLLPIRATIMPVQRSLPVNIQTVIGGPMPFVVTDTGQRIGPGGSTGNHTLSSVGDKEVIFDGKQRIRIPR